MMLKLTNLALLILSVGVSVTCAATPNVRFSASLETSPPAITKDTPVIFNQVQFNYGQDYQGTTGVFTAPQNGIYEFSFTLRTYVLNGIYAHLRVNNIVQSEMYTGDGRTAVSTNTRLIELKQGDKVNVVLYYTTSTGQQISCSSWKNCLFSGVLIA